MDWLRCWLAGIFVPVAIAAQTSSVDWNDLGNQAVDRHDYVTAESYFRKAVAEFQSLGPNYEAHLAASLLNLAVTVCAEGKRIDGAAFYEESLALHRRSLGPKHLRTMANLNRMAANYLALGEVDRADRLYAEASLIERALYPDDLQLAHSLSGLSAAHLRKGQGADALPLGEEALVLARRVAGDRSLDTAHMYANVAEIHHMLGRPERALPLFRKARSIYEKALGQDDSRVSSLLSQEGLILLNEGKLSLADQILTRAMDGFRKSCPLCVPEVTVAENNVGLVRLKQKRYADADQLFSHALSLQEKYLSRPGREMANTLHNLAVLREKEQLYADARSLEERATTILGLL